MTSLSTLMPPNIGLRSDALQANGLGGRFLTAVGSAFDAIERYPQMFAQVHGEVRRPLRSQFPYGVFCRVESKRVVVLAVLHTARDPRLWPQPRRSAR